MFRTHRFRVSLFDFRTSVRAASFLFSLFCFLSVGHAQTEVELRARARIFPEVGAGVTALKSRRVGAARHYYILVSRVARAESREAKPQETRDSGRGAAVLIYDAEGKRVGQIPSPSDDGKGKGRSADPRLEYGDDLDLDEAGRVYVADRGAGAIRVFGPDGALEHSFAIVGPTSVAALGDDEIAVATMRSPHLVTVLAPAAGAPGVEKLSYKLAREFGLPAEIAERAELNRFLNLGRLATDSAHHVYYAFTYLPEPTVRKYDRFGYAVLEIELATLDFQPLAQAARREIERQPGRGTPALKPVVNAIAVDAQTQEIWLAIGGLLLHFQADGTRRATYRIFTAEGLRVIASAILVEPDRLLVASDTLGIFEFPRPEKPRR